MFAPEWDGWHGTWIWIYCPGTENESMEMPL
jgi:hypothetical protein